MKNLSRKEREYNRRREEILESALSVFSEKGFYGATMVQISQASEYPLGTIYKFFSGKEQIFHDMVIERGNRLGKILYEISKNKAHSAEQRISGCLMATARFLKNNKEFIRVYISLRSSIDVVLVPELNRNINKMHEHMVMLYTNLFQECVDTGVFKAYPPKDMASLFSGIIFTSVWPWLSESPWLSDTDEDQDAIEARVKNAFDIFMNGISVNE